MRACQKQVDLVVLYRALWGCGAVLLLVAIPVYRQHAAFYSLIIIGFLLLLTGCVLWMRKQVIEQAKTAERLSDLKKSRTLSLTPLPVLTSVQGKQQEQSRSKPLPVTAELVTVPQGQATETVASVASVAVADVDTRVQATYTLPAVQAKKPKASALRTKGSRRRASVKLSENSGVKEFSKFESSSAVSGKITRTVATKGIEDSAPKSTTALVQTSNAATEASGGGETAASLFALQFGSASKYIYPTVEDIRTERERLNHRPETPEIDRKRRTSMVREYAMALGHPRDGSLLPLITR